MRASSFRRKRTKNGRRTKTLLSYRYNFFDFITFTLVLIEFLMTQNLRYIIRTALHEKSALGSPTFYLVVFNTFCVRKSTRVAFIRLFLCLWCCFRLRQHRFQSLPRFHRREWSLRHLRESPRGSLQRVACRFLCLRG